MPTIQKGEKTIYYPFLDRERKKEEEKRDTESLELSHSLTVSESIISIEQSATYYPSLPKKEMKEEIELRYPMRPRERK